MTPLVLVHGFMGGSEQWRLQTPLGENRDLLAVDLPGFGMNAHLTPIDRIEDFADWVLEHVSQQGVREFDLIGHSMGGMVVQEMTHQAPDRVGRLILYGTGPVGALPGRFEPIENSMQRARDDGPRTTARRIAATWFREGEANTEYDPCAAIAEQSSLAAILAGLKAMRGWSGAEYLQDISSKTLILWGDRDRTYPWSQVEMLWHGITNSAIAVVPDCAHAVHSEAPAVFNLIVERFLSGE